MNWFWHVLWICLVVIPVTLLWVSCLIDIIVRSDLSGWGKVGWVLAVLIIPLFGALIYLIARPATAADSLLDGGEAPPATTTTHGGSTTDELSQLARLHDSGKLTDAEFATQKARVLGTTSATPNHAAAPTPQ
jgi:hypothetical protein